MPDAKDILQQIEGLAPDGREFLLVRLFEELYAPWFDKFPYPFPPFFTKFRLPEFPSVVSTPGVCGGSPRLIRTRIPVWLLEHMRRAGFPESKILESYPTLTAGDLVQAWAYVRGHRAEIDREIEENERY